MLLFESIGTVILSRNIIIRGLEIIVGFFGIIDESIAITSY